MEKPVRDVCFLAGCPNFVKWNGSEIIPGEIDAYCSDWYEPRAEKLTRQEAAGMSDQQIINDERPVEKGN